MLKREPSVIVMLVVYALTRMVDGLDLTEQVGTETIEWVAQFVIILGGALIVRLKVFSEHTIREAGMTPSQVEAMAESPSIKPAVGP